MLTNDRIEESVLNAWPGLQQVLLDGWVLRFSNGYTFRANSVHVLHPSRLDVSRKIEMCEALYRAKNLPPIFRITPQAVAEGLDERLEKRGYPRGNDSLVLGLDAIDPAPADEQHALHVHDNIDEWLALYSHFKRVPLATQTTHRAIVSLVPAGRVLASIQVEGVAVACAMGVVDQDLFGVYDVVVDPDHRNRGCGRQLMSALLNWAARNGARRAYLLVDADNAPALSLYTRLGYRTLYPYWYRRH